MANKYLDTALVDKAIKFAVDAHAGTERRGKGFPYVIHVLEAMEIVATISNDPELLAAAALHDTIEDTSVTYDRLKAEFGGRIADLVDSESDRFDNSLSEEDSWRSRKQAAIDRIAAGTRDSKIVAMGDKLSNMRAIARDYRKQGDALWTLFHAPGGRADHAWHYRGLAGALIELSGTDAYSEFCHLIDDVFGAPVPELVDMSEWEESGDGFSAISYNHRDGKRMMKLYSSYIPADMPLHELMTVCALNKLGLKTPEAYGLVTDGQRIGVQFQRINPKRSFARAISEEPEKLEHYARLFARECRTLHSTQCNTALFGSAKNKFSNNVLQNKELDDAEKAKILAFIHDAPDATTCLHGDLHIGNIISDGKENWWIDLGDFSYGVPEFDLAMFYFLSHNTPAPLVEQMFHMTLEDFRKVWYIFGNEYYGGKYSDEELDAHIAPYAGAYVVLIANRMGLKPDMRQLLESTLLA